MMNEKIITLRGHHLSILYDYATIKHPLGLKSKDEKVVKAAIDDGRSEKMGKNIVRIMRQILEGKVKVRLVDSLDDICALCKNRTRECCINYIPHRWSGTSTDRSTLFYYRLQKRLYNAQTILERLLAQKEIC